MSAVEFLDPDEHTAEHTDEHPHGHADGRTDRFTAAARVADIGLSLIGAALLVAASFATIYTIDLGIDEGPDNYSVDGWGRLGLARGVGGQHAARVGIVLCAAAGVVVLGVAIRLLRPAARRLGAALALVGTGAAAAMAANALLDGSAAQDSYRAAVSGDLELSPGQAQTLPTVHFGGFVWLAAIGAACSVLALVLPAAVGRGSGATVPQPTPEFAFVAPELAPDDEQL